MEVSESTSIIHSFYSQETNSPVYLCLDCLMSEGRLGMKTFISNDVLLDGEAVATQFVPIPCEKAYTPEEKAGGKLGQLL